MAIDLLRGASERGNALRAGVILIGGNSARMGVDKSSLVLDGQTLLDHTIAAVSPLVGEILIVGKPGVAPLHDSPSSPVQQGSGQALGLGSKPGVDLGELLGDINRPQGIGRGAAGGFKSPEHSAQTASLTIRRVADRWPGEGPLGGILSAFASTTAMELLVVAVDLPWLSVDSLRSLCAAPMAVEEQLVEEQADATKERHESGNGDRKSTKATKLKGSWRNADCVMTVQNLRLQPLHARYVRGCEALMAARFAAGERSILRCQLITAEYVAADGDRSAEDVDTPEEWSAALNT
jgi:molybdopterin-guanine dinucleotide biosynthesis protein A